MQLHEKLQVALFKQIATKVQLGRRVRDRFTTGTHNYFERSHYNCTRVCVPWLHAFTGSCMRDDSMYMIVSTYVRSFACARRRVCVEWCACSVVRVRVCYSTL